uniref:Uncharacterized protein n=1 Tax=Oryza nivara TaxID=4536 RepID=A0A0E0H1Y5_ORYNI
MNSLTVAATANLSGFRAKWLDFYGQTSLELHRGKEMRPFMKARKSSSIMAVTGSSGDSPSTCFTITLNANCGSQGKRAHQREKKKRKVK